MHGKTFPSSIQLPDSLAPEKMVRLSRPTDVLPDCQTNEQWEKCCDSSRCETFLYRREKSAPRKIVSELFPLSTNRTDDVMMLFASPEQIQTPLVVAREDVFSFLFRVCLINNVFTYPQICLISILAVIVMGMWRVSTCGDWRSRVSDFWTVFWLGD